VQTQNDGELFSDVSDAVEPTEAKEATLTNFALAWITVCACVLLLSVAAQAVLFLTCLTLWLNVYITMENRRFQWVNPLFLWQFSIANC